MWDDILFVTGDCLLGLFFVCNSEYLVGLCLCVRLSCRIVFVCDSDCLVGLCFVCDSDCLVGLCFV